MLKIKEPKAKKRYVSIPLSVEQILYGVRQLSPEDRTRLEQEIDAAFYRTVFRRGKALARLRRAGRLIPLEKIQQEFPRV